MSMASSDEPLKEHRLPLDFWEEVRRARRHLLMLDYDGTLVPFRAERSQAWLPGQTRELLRLIAGQARTFLVVISGRGIAELEALLGPTPAHLVGEHGWEERTPQGRLIRRPLPGEMAKVLGAAARAARANGWDRYLERKRCSLVLHTRGLPADRAAEIEAEGQRLWGTLFERGSLRLTRIDGGLELRALTHHEGTAVAGLIVSAPPGTLPVYLGDDLSDEEAFYEVLGRGVAVRVGSGERDSMAHFNLATTDDVLSFLAHWEETVRQPTR